MRSPPKCSFIDWMVSRKFPRLARRQKWLFAICAPEKLQFVQISSFVREAVVMMVIGDGGDKDDGDPKML